MLMLSKYCRQVADFLERIGARTHKEIAPQYVEEDVDHGYGDPYGT